MDPSGMPPPGPQTMVGTVLITGTSHLLRTTRTSELLVVLHFPRLVVRRCHHRLLGRVWARNNGPRCGGPKPITWCTTTAKITRGTILSPLNAKILEGTLAKVPVMPLLVCQGAFHVNWWDFILAALLSCVCWYLVEAIFVQLLFFFLQKNCYIKIECKRVQCVFFFVFSLKKEERGPIEDLKM
jgi:hypothetical protein